MNSNWSEQQNARTEVKEKNKVRKEKLAGYFFDLSKLTFAAIVLGGLSPLITDKLQNTNVVLILSGILSTFFLAFFANKILK